LMLEMLKDLDQPILDAEADWKALVERGAGYPLRVAEQRGGRGLVSRQMHRASLRCRAGPDVEEPHGLSVHSGNLQHAPGTTREQHRNGGRESGQFGRERLDHPHEHSGQSMPSGDARLWRLGQMDDADERRSAGRDREEPHGAVGLRKMHPRDHEPAHPERHGEVHAGHLTLRKVEVCC